MPSYGPHTHTPPPPPPTHTNRLLSHAQTDTYRKRIQAHTHILHEWYILKHCVCGAN
ncbi:Hypothetical protein FKW44_006732 [Caligus rogercresseyi]|uniref:Uncharacterized protein n=1 Tax=Caligus rogercresseyi TaxID=217165 RepID=A0A7T8KDR8_CALRO|nr:Hypothetical protein FKW44_006732 [Caligus rogercresseyi]